MQIREFVSPSLLVSFQNTALLTVQVLHTYLYGKNRRHKSTCGHADSTEFFCCCCLRERLLSSSSWCLQWFLWFCQIFYHVLKTKKKDRRNFLNLLQRQHLLLSAVPIYDQKIMHFLPHKKNIYKYSKGSCAQKKIQQLSHFLYLTRAYIHVYSINSIIWDFLASNGD